jgi:hypothetical protein
VFTAAVPTGIHAVSRDSMAQWGPPMPREFTRPKPGLAMLRELLHNLRHVPDLDFGKLVQLMKLFG